MNEFQREYERQIKAAVEAMGHTMAQCEPNASPEEQAAIIREIAQGAPEGSVKRLEMEMAATIVMACASATGTQHRLLLCAQECIRQMEWARSLGERDEAASQHGDPGERPPLTLAPEGWKP